MTSRPTVSVFSGTNEYEISDNVTLPAVFSAPIRLDIVQTVHTNISKNRRQAHAVHFMAGKQTTAASWGTGRAVARIPRVGGSGTHRSGQAAYGNMCRGGHMFAPLKVWRRWHRKTNVTQKRHAVASAIAASAVPGLVMARGHKINEVPEIPLIVDNLKLTKTKDLIKLLESFGVEEDLRRVRDSKKLKAGRGKSRGKRYALRKGPLIVYTDESSEIKKAARNIPGVEVCNVHRLSLLKLAPGGHIGRFVIWTRDAIKQLNSIFGTYRRAGDEKKGYHLERPLLKSADLAAIINSDPVQSKLNETKKNVHLHEVQKKNPLRNRGQLKKLNPYLDSVKRQAATAQTDRLKKIEELRKQKKGLVTAATRKEKKGHRQVIKKLNKTLFSDLEEAQKRDAQKAKALEVEDFEEAEEEAEEESE